MARTKFTVYIQAEVILEVDDIDYALENLSENDWLEWVMNQDRMHVYAVTTGQDTKDYRE